MDLVLIFLFVVCVLVRVSSLLVSKRHEAVLVRTGAVEHGALNTRMLATAHGLFYLACLGEGIARSARFDMLSFWGLVLYACAIAMLVWVAHLLGPVWTVKIMIARNHVLNRHWLFRIVRHPNYYLNILPELVGLALMLHAFLTLAVGLPIYLIFLIIRIRQEEAAMSELFRTQA